MILYKSSCILLAIELCLCCVKSATGLHNETSGLPGLAGLQSCRSKKTLWTDPALCRTWNALPGGIFAVLPLKTAPDMCNAPICLLTFRENFLSVLDTGTSLL